MRLTKTDHGIQVLRDRSVALTARQRGALILCDARHPKARVLANAAAAGVSELDIQYLIQIGLVAEVRDEQEIAAARMAQEFRDRPTLERFRDAYPMAVKLSGSLGLRGFRINMAVEKASSYEDLCKVASTLKAAVKPEAFRPLERLLFG